MSVLFVRLPNHLGDACMCLPALNLLAARGAQIVLVGKAWASDLFAAYGWPLVPVQGTLREQVRSLRAARKQYAGEQRVHSVLFTNSFGTALRFRLAGLNPFGYATDARRWLLKQAVPADQSLHMVGYYHALAHSFARAFTGNSETLTQLPSELGLRLTATAEERAARLLVEAKVQAPYIMLCPVAVGLHRGRVKAWDGFGRLCDGLIARGEPVVVCPGPGEREAVLRATPNATLLPQTDVGTFAALLARSRLVVANDSGSGHLAAAVGTPLISVFGVTEPARTQPWGARVTRVGSERGWPSYDEVAAAVSRTLGG